MSVFKQACITPETVLAGDTVEFSITLTAGNDFSAENTRILLDLPGYLGYTRPSCYSQEAPGYMEVFCSNPDLVYTKKTAKIGEEPFPEKPSLRFFDNIAKRIMVLNFTGGEAREDDEILIKWGYVRDNFGIGTTVTTLVLAQEFLNTVHVRYFRDNTNGFPDYARSFKGYTRPEPDEEIPLTFRVLPREPEKMRLIRSAGKAALLVMDRFGNVSDVKNPGEFIEETPYYTRNQHGVFEIPDPNVIITAKKLPLSETPDMTDVFEGYNIYFGDMHTHSAISNDCIEREKQEMTPEMHLVYARDVSRLDFITITDHHQPWDIERNKIQKDEWEAINDAVSVNKVDGEFIAFPGFEFRCERGDTAVTINERMSYSEIDIPHVKNIRDFWDYMKGRDYITIPHFHNQGRLGYDEWYECPYDGVEPVAEIYSCHGSYEMLNTLERRPPENYRKRDKNGKYLLERGYRYGYVCNSDGHKGNPGRNGLTAVYTKELTGTGILNAIRNRHVYGTTNARIRLLFTANGCLMGSCLKNTPEKQFHIAVTGEDILKAVDLLRNGELYKRYRPSMMDFQIDVDVKEEAASNWYVRAIQEDNHIAYSSPIWFE